MEHPFDADTAVHAAGDQQYRASITDRWNALGGRPNGGYLLATCLQALRRSMPFPDPLVASAFFLRPALVGPAAIRTEIARAGRRLATGEARLFQEDKEIVRAVASFADLAAATGRTLMLGAPPSLPPPDDAIDLLGGQSIAGLTIVDRVEYRMRARPGWVQGRPSGDPTLALWIRFKEPRDADVFALPLLVDVVFPAVMEIGATGAVTVELTVHVRGRPVPGWLACRVTTRHVVDGYHEEDFEIWDAAGRLVAQSRQLALLPPSAEPAAS